MKNKQKLIQVPGAEQALEYFKDFLLSDEQAIIISGGPGVGKSHFIGMAIDAMKPINELNKVMDLPIYDTAVTATTKDACSNLQQVLGDRAVVSTIHSALGLRVHIDYSSGRSESSLVEAKNVQFDNIILFVDESSKLSSELINRIYKCCKSNVKIVFVGDPDQLLDIKATHAVAFELPYTTIEMTEVRRQDNTQGIHPITELGYKFKNLVRTRETFSFTPDGHHVIHMSGEQFLQAIEDEFTRPNWVSSDSRILVWRNKTVQAYNEFVATKLLGSPDGFYSPGNMMTTANYIPRHFSKGETVVLHTVEPHTFKFDSYSTSGYLVTFIGKSGKFFVPSSPLIFNEARGYAAINKLSELAWAVDQWVDLRAPYASTIDMAQGASFKTTFIDLDDIDACHQKDRVARMLFVGSTRARHKLILTGDVR